MENWENFSPAKPHIRDAAKHNGVLEFFSKALLKRVFWFFKCLPFQTYLYWQNGSSRIYHILWCISSKGLIWTFACKTNQTFRNWLVMSCKYIIIYKMISDTNASPSGRRSCMLEQVLPSSRTVKSDIQGSMWKTWVVNDNISNESTPSVWIFMFSYNVIHSSK